MTMRVHSLEAGLGAEISSVTLAAPLDPATVAGICAALDEYGVLVFRDQPLADDEHVRCARHFGALGMFPPRAERAGLPPEIFLASNVDAAGRLLPPGSERLRIVSLNLAWHADGSYQAVPPRGAVLRGIEILTDSGDTVFANLAAAWQTLPQGKRRTLESLRARHSFEFMTTGGAPQRDHDRPRTELPAVEHRLVRQHADGRRSLYLSPPYMDGIVGWDAAASRELIEELTAWATEERYAYRHRWRAHDVLMWDNAWTMHKVTHYDILHRRRIMHGTVLL
jgi:alpha-ketoglutarate-dependent 2,4-dichlorophenoxyacetate dioxygenase